MSFRPGASRALLFAACMLLTNIALATDVADSGAKDKDSSTRPRIRFGGLTIGAGYSHFSGSRYGYPYYAYHPWGPWGSYGWPYAYDPFLYGPYLHPGFFSGFGYGPAMGEVKIKSADHNAWVYLDGGLAGKAEKLKTIWLEPGAYNLEIRAGDRKFGQKIYVLSGRTLKLTADMARSEVRP